MKEFFANRYRAVLHMALLLAFGGCSAGVSVEPTARSNGTLDRTITKNSVGEYKVGHSTLEEVLGADTTEVRKQFASAGLQFEFNQGKELTGIIVTSHDYSLENGLTIGSTSDAVKGELGPPLKTNVEVAGKGIQLDALVYDDFIFMLDDAKKVAAIRVGQ